jgi:hypothetical protein
VTKCVDDVIRSASEITQRGTKSLIFVPHRENDFYVPTLGNEFQTITFQVECRAFSLEELRLSDYLQEHKCLLSKITNVVSETREPTSLIRQTGSAQLQM